MTLGTSGKDNVYGAGRIDVFDAIREHAIFTIKGTVLDKNSRTSISNAIVRINTTAIPAVTNASGFYSLTVFAGTYNLTAIFDPAYNTNNTIMASTIGKMFVVQNIELTKKQTGTIRGNVADG